VSSIDNAIVKVEFEDGTVTLGGGEFFVESNEGFGSVVFDQDRLNLIANLQSAQAESEGAVRG
jgi:hypothetical protein